LFNPSIGATFGLSPSQLGLLTLSRALVQAFTSPFAGYLSTFVPRMNIIGGGCILWGICTFVVGSATSFEMALVFSAINGCGLAVVIPSVQSVLADYYPAEVRGASFGFMGFVSALGGVLGGIYATNLGGKVIMGRSGWRFVFHSTGIVSILLGFLVMIFGHDPSVEKRPSPQGTRGRLKEYFRTIWHVMSISSFRIIIAQGIFGTVPWNALSYMTLWFQLLGFSDWQSSLMRAVFAMGQSCGNLLGGILGDIASQLFPDSGRVLIAQTSVASGLPLSILLLRGLPQSNAIDLVPWYTLALAVMGLSVSWSASACNAPVFADIVPPEMRTAIYAFDRSFEGSIGAFGTPIVGYIAQHGFGMTLRDAYSHHGKSLKDAKALSDALLVMLLYPWSVCLFFYFLLHIYYKRDKLKAKAFHGYSALSD